MWRITARILPALVTFLIGISLSGVLNGWRELGKDLSPIPARRECSHRLRVTASDPEQELLNMYRRYGAAQTEHNAAFFEGIEPENFVLFDAGGESFTRAEDIEIMKSLPPETRYENHDLRIQFYGDAAVVTGTMTATFGQGIQQSWRWIDVCIRRNAQWQILSTTQID